MFTATHVSISRHTGEPGKGNLHVKRFNLFAVVCEIKSTITSKMFATLKEVKMGKIWNFLDHRKLEGRD